MICITLSVLIMCVLFITYIFAPHSGGESRTTAFLILISYFPAVYFPLVIFLTVYIFKILQTKENKNLDFRIKNHLLTNTIAIRIVLNFSLLIFLSYFIILSMKYISNKYISLNLFNYFLLSSNIGFLIYAYNVINEYKNFQKTEIIFLIGNYYIYVIPICLILLLYFLFSERKKKLLNKNSKIQLIITIASIIIFLFVILAFILFILVTLYIITGLDM